MSLAPNIVDIGARGWHLSLSTRSNGSGEAKLQWDSDGHMHPEFWSGFSSPAAALEVVLGRVEANGGLSPLDIPVLVGILCGYFERRAA